MNFADAIRKVHGDASANEALGMGEPVSAVKEAAPAFDMNAGVPNVGFGIGMDSGNAPAPVSPAVQSGNVVRLELFLSAEQISGLFRAIMAGQHTVMTAREAAAYLRVGKDTLMKLAEEGEIPGIVIDGRWRFPKPNLDEWLTMQSVNHEEIEDVA